jgi:hypothetical protein
MIIVFLILSFLVSFGYSFRQSHFNQDRFFRSAQHFLHFCDYNNDIQQLCDVLGPKRTLQELCQNLFQGHNPVYTWYDNDTLHISVLPSLQFDYKVRGEQNRSLTNAIKKEQENKASMKMIKTLQASEQYNALVLSYISQRVNRDNIPTHFTRDDMINFARMKLLVILVDIENIPDFRKVFYTSKDGDIRFLFPAPPPLRTAPSLSVDNSDINNEMSHALIGGNYERPYLDEEILVLAYAHARGPQSVWANRVTYSNNKDAADGKFLFSPI